MAKLTWDAMSDRTYEYGVSKVVLYSKDGTKFSKWSGVTSIKETSVNSSFEELYFNGQKFYNYPSSGDYQADVSALSFPKEFLGPLGVKESRPGFFLTNQDREVFHMTYQTQTSYDGYKIHFVANIVSSRASSESKTLDSSTNPEVFSWKFSAVPPDVISGVRPYPKVIVDSEKIDPESLTIIENYIYGSEVEDPRFPIENLFVDI
jgi:hypothetical protein